ncbi:MAG: Maf family protein [Planctomycetota bacterium]
MSGSGELVTLLSPLILASASPRRRKILSGMGLQFRIVPANVDETAPPGLPPERVAESLALKKALSVAAGVESGTVLGADTVVVGADGSLLGKPLDFEHARAMLAGLSGTTHRVITGVALVHRPGGQQVLGHDVTSVTMRAMSQGEIEEYVSTGEPFGKAGAYAIQEHADRFVSRLEGEYDNVVGLPSRRLRELFLRLERSLSGQGGVT